MSRFVFLPIIAFGVFFSIIIAQTPEEAAIRYEKIKDSINQIDLAIEKELRKNWPNYRRISMLNSNAKLQFPALGKMAVLKNADIVTAPDRVSAEMTELIKIMERLRTREKKLIKEIRDLRKERTEQSRIKAAEKIKQIENLHRELAFNRGQIEGLGKLGNKVTHGFYGAIKEFVEFPKKEPVTKLLPYRPLKSGRLPR